MFDPRTESSDHGQFDLICSTLEDYEHLPELTPVPPERPRIIDPGEHEDRIDAEILAGLVLP